MPSSNVRIAALGDTHITKDGRGTLRPLFREIGSIADILVLCGDLTDNGLPDEARLFADEIAELRIPVVAVLGNHDFESGREDEVAEILRTAHMIVLDGDTYEVAGVGFAGVKGFGGGFGREVVSAWGEAALKGFVRESMAEAQKLDGALAGLAAKHRVAVMHYAPIRMTVEPEPAELLAFLGCSRLEEPVNKFGCSVVFHGHAHHGTLYGRTTAGIPVFNVSMSLVAEKTSPRKNYLVYDLVTSAP